MTQVPHAGAPLDAGWVARRKSSCDELAAVGNWLWWLQSDPDQGGNTRVMRGSSSDRPVAVTPPGVEVGGWLHAYGGGSFVVTRRGLWFVDAADSTVWLLDLRSGVKRRMVAQNDGFVYGDLQASPTGVLAVRESEAHGDQIVEISASGNVRVLVRSPGFLGAPMAHGRDLAYVEWGEHEMPWDASRLHVSVCGTTAITAKTDPDSSIAGGPEESVIEPQWGPEGALYFLSDRTGWWNLYRWRDGETRSVLAIDQDCAAAPWEAGYRSYTFLPCGSIGVTMHDGLRTRLATVGPDSDLNLLDDGLTSVKPYLAAFNGRLAVIAATSSSAPAVRLLDPTRPDDEALCLNRDDDAEGAERPPGSVRACQATSAGRVIRFLLRLPPDGQHGAMPLLVRAHPGPTDAVPLRLDWAAEYFTSRGFAVADVAYRGSSGQGRAYRQVLHGHWGEYDAQDCAAVARHLLNTGVAQPCAVFISGASAGGYTALKAACLPGPFIAATATSAIIDPQRWARTAPRFQRPHAAILAGPAGRVRAEEIKIPVLVIHGTGDAVAPVRDAQDLAAQLVPRGEGHEALILPGGGHYLSENGCREAALTAEAAFYARLTSGAR